MFFLLCVVRLVDITQVIDIESKCKCVSLLYFVTRVIEKEKRLQIMS
jgi:hypothetical protein